ncbi:hypothetical protein S83_038714, partial [Arachis hypogaea]
ALIKIEGKGSIKVEVKRKIELGPNAFPHQSTFHVVLDLNLSSQLFWLLRKGFQKIHVRLLRELEKKFSGKHGTVLDFRSSNVKKLTKRQACIFLCFKMWCVLCNHSTGHAGKSAVRWTEIQSWFKDGLQDLLDDPNNELMIPKDPKCNKEDRTRLTLNNVEMITARTI